MPNNAIDEGRLGELPEDFLSERALREPMVGPVQHLRRIIGAAPTNIPGNFPGQYLNRNKFATYPFTAELAAAKIVTANIRRVYLLVQNNSATEMFVNFGSNPTLTNAFIIPGGGSQEFIGANTGEGGGFCPWDDVYILGDVGGQAGIAGEGTFPPLGA